MTLKNEIADIELMKKIVGSSDAGFNELVRLAGLEPTKDFEFQDLSELDFGQADLRGYSFRGSDLSHSNLESCIADQSTNFIESTLKNTKLPLNLRIYYGDKYSRIIIFVASEMQFAEMIVHQVTELLKQKKFLTTHVVGTDAVIRILMGGKMREKNKRDIFVVDNGVEDSERITIRMRDIIFEMRNELILDRVLYMGVEKSSRRMIKGEIRRRGFVGEIISNVNDETKVQQIIVDAICKH
jgi:Pentapeptide repeats (8 copies)